MKTEWQFDPQESASRLDSVVSKRLGIGRNEAQVRVVSGLVTVDGKVNKKVSYKLDRKAVIGVGAIDSKNSTSLPPPLLQPVYVDRHLAVVDKPPGVVVHSGAGHFSGTISDALKLWSGEVSGLGVAGREGIVHRLDKDTSGLMVVALSRLGFDGLNRAVKRRELKRIYIALVVGAPPVPQGIIDAPLGRHLGKPIKRTVVYGGKYARTHYKTLESLPHHTLLELKLETGRTHQIRAHCAAMKMPVAGDRVYGNRHPPQGLERQFLHSSRLSFVHPVDGLTLKFKSALPQDLRSVWDKLRYEYL